MKKYLISLVAAFSLALGGCATTAYNGMVYEDGSYYAPASEGNGDYYLAPEPQPYWHDPFFDPFYGPYGTPWGYPFSAGYGGHGHYCSAMYRFCPMWATRWYDPWYDPWYVQRNGFSIHLGSGWFGSGYGGGWHGGGWYRGGHHGRDGRWTPPRHRRPPPAAAPAGPTTLPVDGVASAPGGGGDAGDGLDRGMEVIDDGMHGRPLPRAGWRRVPNPGTSTATGPWPAWGAPRAAPGSVAGPPPGSRSGGGQSNGGRGDGDRGGGVWSGGNRGEGRSGGGQASGGGRRSSGDSGASGRGDGSDSDGDSGERRGGRRVRSGSDD